MIRCAACGRFHRAEEAACPFCSAATSTLGKLTRTAAACVSAMVLMACYGAPPGGFDDTADTSDTAALEDLDSDGYDVSVDCDDTDAAINPGATEICDDEKDNDCDEQVDAADDDCATG